MRQIAVSVIFVVSIYTYAFSLSIHDRDILCQKGNGVECLKLGIAYEDADGVERNNTMANMYYKKGCEKKNALACMGLGIRYARGVGIDVNYTKAVEYMKNACEGDFKTCAILGNMYAHGKGVEKDLNKSIMLYEKACDAGENMGCSDLAQVYKTGKGVEKDSNKTNYYNDKACALGDKNACFNLGNTYLNGRNGVKQNYGKSISYYKKSCHNKSAKGCSNVGALYERGSGVKKDFEQAKHYYSLACSHGYMSACSNIGVLYEQGKGVTQSYVTANEFYSMACMGNDAEGCYNFALLYDLGQGLEQDYDKAYTAYKKSCDNNYVKACANLGMMYVYGKGVVKDYAQAKSLWKKACDGGNSLACKNYKKVLTLPQTKTSTNDVKEYIASIQKMIESKKSAKVISYKIYEGYVFFMENSETFFTYNDEILSMFVKNNWQIKSLARTMKRIYTKLDAETFGSFFEQLPILMSTDTSKDEHLDRLMSDLPYVYLDYMDKKFKNILTSEINTSSVVLYDLEGKEVNSSTKSREYVVSEYYKAMSDFYDEELDEDKLALEYAKKAIDTCNLNPDALFHYAYLTDDSTLSAELLEKVLQLTNKNDALLDRDTYSLYNNLGYAIWDSKKIDAYDKALKYLEKAYNESEEEGLNSLGTMAYIYMEQKKFSNAYDILKQPLYGFIYVSNEELADKDNVFWYYVRAVIDTTYILKDYNSTKFLCKRYLSLYDKEYEDCLTMVREIESLPKDTALVGEFSYWELMSKPNKSINMKEK